MDTLTHLSSVPERSCFCHRFPLILSSDVIIILYADLFQQCQATLLRSSSLVIFHGPSLRHTSLARSRRLCGRWHGRQRRESSFALIWWRIDTSTSWSRRSRLLRRVRTWMHYMHSAHVCRPSVSSSAQVETISIKLSVPQFSSTNTLCTSTFYRTSYGLVSWAYSNVSGSVLRSCRSN